MKIHSSRCQKICVFCMCLQLLSLSNLLYFVIDVNTFVTLLRTLMNTQYCTAKTPRCGSNWGCDVKMQTEVGWARGKNHVKRRSTGWHKANPAASEKPPYNQWWRQLYIVMSSLVSLCLSRVTCMLPRYWRHLGGAAERSQGSHRWCRHSMRGHHDVDKKRWRRVTAQHRWHHSGRESDNGRGGCVERRPPTDWDGRNGRSEEGQGGTVTVRAGVPSHDGDCQGSSLTGGKVGPLAGCIIMCSVSVKLIGCLFIGHRTRIIFNLFNMPGTHCYVPQCINRGNGHVTNDHLQAKTTAFHERYDTFYVTKTRAQIKIKYFLFLILCLSDFSALLLLLALASSSCLIYKFISKQTHNPARCHELMCQVLPTGGQSCTVPHCCVLHSESYFQITIPNPLCIRIVINVLSPSDSVVSG